MMLKKHFQLTSPLHLLTSSTQLFLFHDETTLQANEDQPTVWALKGTKVIQSKSKGSVIMISDFIYEQTGYLALMDEEYKRAKQSDPTIKKHARQWLEYGEAKEGYWTSDKFMKQTREVAKIVDFKFRRDASWKIF